jgi:hypothetical protein
MYNLLKQVSPAKVGGRVMGGRAATAIPPQAYLNSGRGTWVDQMQPDWVVASLMFDV